MTVGPRASTERKEEKQEGNKMTLTVEYYEMTATNVEHFKITATTSANWVTPTRAQEEYMYKQKKKFSPRPHAHSHVFE